MDVLHHNADVGTWSNSGQYLTTKLRTEDSREPPGTSGAIGPEGVKCGEGTVRNTVSTALRLVLRATLTLQEAAAADGAEPDAQGIGVWSLF